MLELKLRDDTGNSRPDPQDASQPAGKILVLLLWSVLAFWAIPDLFEFTDGGRFWFRGLVVLFAVIVVSVKIAGIAGDHLKALALGDTQNRPMRDV